VHVDEHHPDTQRGENARVLEADDPGTDHGERLRQLLHPQQIIGCEDAFAVATTIRITDRRRTDRDHNMGGRHLLSHAFLEQIEANAMRIDERRTGVEDVDVISQQLMACDVDFVVNDLIHAEQEIPHRDVLLDGIGRAVNAAFPIAGQPERRLAQRLARNRAGVDTDATDYRFLLHDRDALFQLRGLNRRPMTGRSRANDEEVVVVGHVTPRLAVERVHIRSPV